MTINQTIEQLEKDYQSYGNICTFKLKKFKDSNFKEINKCRYCNGYSTVNDCEDFVDIYHLIYFYKNNNINYDKEGYYK